LHHPKIGDIDLVWGKEGTAAKEYEDGYGLSKIVKKHPEVIDDLQRIIESCAVKEDLGSRIILESSDHRAVVSLEYFGAAKKWLLTAYETTGKR
jgi:hypothetical protein